MHDVRGHKLTYLGEKRIEAVHLLLLLDIRIVLRHTFQGELVHEIDDARLHHVAVLSVSFAFFPEDQRRAAGTA